MTNSTYQPQSIDTSGKSDRIFFHLPHQRSPLQRIIMVNDMIRSARQMSLSGLRSPL